MVIERGMFKFEVGCSYIAVQMPYEPSMVAFRTSTTREWISLEEIVRLCWSSVNPE